MYNLNTTQPLLSITQRMCQTNHLIYCVFNISTETGYPNISVTKMVYSGPDCNKCTSGLDDNKCMTGGVSIDYGDTNTQREKLFCDNYTQNPSHNSFKKIPMNIVGSGKYIVLIIYSYPPHSSTMEVIIKASITGCKGLLPFLEGK